LPFLQYTFTNRPIGHCLRTFRAECYKLVALPPYKMKRLTFLNPLLSPSSGIVGLIF
jgi:hypothetical protein